MGTATLIQCANPLCHFAPRLAILIAQLQPENVLFTREKCVMLVRAGFGVSIRDEVAYMFPRHICALRGVAISSVGDEQMRVRKEVRQVCA